MLVVGGDNLIDLIEISRDDAAVSFAGARGGSGYNTARATARQGQDVGFITPIAQDNLGHFLADKMVADGVALLSPRSEKTLFIGGGNFGQWPAQLSILPRRYG